MTTPNLELAEPPDAASPIALEERQSARALDALGPGWIAVLSRSITDPPSDAIQGARYIVPSTGATGAWANRGRAVAYRTPDGWEFRAPRLGWIAIVLDEGDPFLTYYYSATEWLPLPAAAVTPVVVDAIDVTFSGYGFPGDPVNVDAALEFLLTGYEDHESRIELLEADVGGGGGGVPGTIDDLLYWFQGDQLKASAGRFIPLLQNSSEPYKSMTPVSSGGGGAAVGATPLNSRNVVTFPGGTLGRYTYNVGHVLHSVTVFAVFRPTSFAAGRTFISGASASFTVLIESATGNLQMVKTNVALIATDTTALTLNAWVQFNCTYDDATGAFEFRRGQSSSSSGTNVQTISGFNSVIGFNGVAAIEDLQGDLAELIVYDRVLNSTEITDVETYLNTKWGV